ncbi:MAG: hypothetical protein HWE20_02465, partial [Gammaproteobacteria bacterium]|nr:hypothetical protein [Gammaproteobacteria bacterium]
MTAQSRIKNIDAWREQYAAKHGLDETMNAVIESDEDIKDWYDFMSEREGVRALKKADGGINTAEHAKQIKQLDEVLNRHKETVWASFVPLFYVGDNIGREKKVEASFALYLQMIDEKLPGRKNQIPRITWRHWYSDTEEEYGYLHFHILYLLDDTGLSAEEVTAIHNSVIQRMKEKDKATLADVSEALEEKKLKEWAAKAGRNYKVKKRESRAVVNAEKSIATKSDNSPKLVGYGSKMKKQKRH